MLEIQDFDSKDDVRTLFSRKNSNEKEWVAM